MNGRGLTTYGITGVKVWVYRGRVLVAIIYVDQEDEVSHDDAEADQAS